MDTSNDRIAGFAGWVGPQDKSEKSSSIVDEPVISDFMDENAYRETIELCSRTEEKILGGRQDVWRT